jgi:hypothetical protein
MPCTGQSTSARLAGLLPVNADYHEIELKEAETA